MGEDARSPILGMPFQVNRDIDLEFVNEPRDGRVAHAADIDETIECRYEPFADIAAIVDPEGNRNDLEPGAIMALEQLRIPNSCRSGDQ
jgi:phage terminase large subunit-like protein